MSIAFGIYDFFSYTVPGILYILVLNHFLSFLQLPALDLNNLNANIGSAILWVVIAYVTGHLLDSFAVRLYYAINKFDAETAAMKEFKEKHQDLPIEFTINDRQTLFSVIRHHNMNLALYIDNFKAISIMLNNVGLALLLLSIEQLTEMFVQGLALQPLVIFIVSLGFSYVALKRSALFNKWHWLAVYNHARQYGKNIPEMFNPLPKDQSRSS